jgi:hypothetical protein
MSIRPQETAKVKVKVHTQEALQFGSQLCLPLHALGVISHCHLSQNLHTLAFDLRVQSVESVRLHHNTIQTSNRWVSHKPPASKISVQS